MGLSGLVGAGAADALDEVILQALTKQKFQEQMRAQQAQEGIQQQRIAQDASQHADLMGLNTRRQDFAETQANEEMQQAGIADLRARTAEQDARFTRLNNEDAAMTAEADFNADPTVPPRVRRLFKAQRLGATNVTADDFMDDAERAAADEAVITRAGRVADAQASAAARYREPREPKPTGVAGMTPGQLTSAKQFQDDYYRDSRTYTTIRNAYQQVAGAAKNPDAAGDLSLIFGYMKMLDPNSVVRETEFANAQNAAGVPDRVRNLWNRAITGERMNPKQREEFIGQARRIWSQAHGNQARVRKTYSDRATKFGIDPSMVLDDEEPMDDNSSAAGPAGTGGGKKFTILGVK